MNEEKSRKIAIFRYGVISDFINQRFIEYGRQEELLRNKCGYEWKIPFSDRTHVSRSSILRWITIYRKGGETIEALFPKGRNDINKSRTIDKITQNNLKWLIQNSDIDTVVRLIKICENPDYIEKFFSILHSPKHILSNLKKGESFFSIDEYGPFAIKIHGGKSLVPPGTTRIIPQWQKTKGSLIITAALELSTNQITHFYSKKKNTDEMLKLLNLLIKIYSNQKYIYFSWDSASWHASKKLYKKVDEINSKKFKKYNKSPIVELVPLPTCAQFLNVIESVFSGMARAIIHNSNYNSVKDCQSAIDSYFFQRNEYFIRIPKRAGNKIWGKERVRPFFSESHNCKDPLYR